jgi:hypothetical protein
VAFAKNPAFCARIRTKTGYFRSPDGVRLIDPESPTACYTCLLTQRPFGPDGMPVTPVRCDERRACFNPDD